MALAFLTQGVSQRPRPKCVDLPGVCVQLNAWTPIITSGATPGRGRNHPLHGAVRRAYPKRRQANHTLADGCQHWKAGQVLQCVDGAF